MALVYLQSAVGLTPCSSIGNGLPDRFITPVIFLRIALLLSLRWSNKYLIAMDDLMIFEKIKY